MPHWARHGSRIPPDAQPHVRADRPAASLAGALAASPLGGRSSATLGLTGIAEVIMDIDTEKVDEAALAILYLTLHDRVRAWKGWIGTSSGGSTRKGLLTIQSVSRSQWCSLTPAFARHSAASANSSARGDVVRRSLSSPA